MVKYASIDSNDSLEERVARNLEPDSDLADEFLRQYRSAVLNKKNTKVGDYTLQELLVDCFNARDDRTLCSEATGILTKYPQWAGMPISIVSFKVGILVALVRESLVDVAQAPFIVDPTPEPEIPEDKKQEALYKVLDDILAVAGNVVQEQSNFINQYVANGGSPNDASSQKGFPELSPDLAKDLLKQQKIKLTQEIRKHAEEQAQLLQRDLYDKTIEGGYRRAILEFIEDFALYPFGCIHGPFPVIQTTASWVKNEFRDQKKVVWAFERISPFDLFWTEDSTDTQDGTAVFIRKHVGYEYLYDCRKMAKDDKKSGYRHDVINELIALSKDGELPRKWTDFDASNLEKSKGNLLWNRGSVIEIVIRYGRFSGHDLVEMGFADIDEDTIYETKTIMCCGKLIQCQINNNPSQYKRPVFTASFERRNSSIAGVGLGQKLLAIHSAYRAVIHLAMYNLGLSSEPVTEVEVNRILQYMPDDWIDEPVISPGMVIPADGDRMGNGSRAIKFTQIPNTTDSALRLASYIFDQAHVISNIPAALHGQPVGSGANRTVRGLLTLQGNTLKPIQSALMNLDLGIIEPMVTLLYMLLVMHEDGFEYTGDCKIIAKGAASMVQREMDKQTAMENLQILGQLGSQINPELLERTVVKLLSTAGILEPGESVMSNIPVMQAPAAGDMQGSSQQVPQEPSQPIQ